MILPLDQALDYGIQIADALDKAHRAGVVHRDLKPGNVMLTKAGVKLLDFGLAKTREESVTPTEGSEQPTQNKPLTDAGTILGTVQYMAPEQLEGKDVDARADLFALGAVLYEMLTGRKAFEGESQASLISAIMSSDPPLVSKVQTGSSAALDRFVAKCLEKDPEQRWQSARDATTELAWLRSEKDTQGDASRTQPKRRKLAWVGALAIALASVALVRTLDRPVPTVARLTMDPGLRVDLVNSVSVPFAISPDGRHVVFEGRETDAAESRALYVRDLDRFDAPRLHGTEGARGPFFSPSGRWVGFHADGTLKKVNLDDGQAVAICPLAETPWGASWGADGTIVYALPGSGLWRVPETGGTPEDLTSVGPDEIGHLDPQVLPDGRNVIFTALTSTQSFISLLSLKTGEWHPLFEGTRGRYAPTQHIVYAVQESLWAAAYDPDELELGEPAIPLPERVRLQGAGAMTSYYDVSLSGALAYAAADLDATKVVWVDRRGREADVADAERGAHTVRLSPDGRRFAMDVVGDMPAIWNYDVARGTRVLVSRDATNPLWAPGGQEIWFAEANNIYAKAADGTREERLLFDRDFVSWPLSLSPDGRFLAATETHPKTGRDIWVLSRDHDPVPFVVTPNNENAPAFSPDGHWIAYQSNASGRYEIYVEPFPGPGTRTLVSTRGGTAPVWSPTGQELFYREGTALMSVAVRAGDTFYSEEPSIVFDGPYLADGTGHPSYDVAADGESFLMLRAESSLNEIRIVLGWSKELETATLSEQ